MVVKHGATKKMGALCTRLSATVQLIVRWVRVCRRAAVQVRAVPGHLPGHLEGEGHGHAGRLRGGVQDVRPRGSGLHLDGRDVPSTLCARCAAHRLRPSRATLPPPPSRPPSSPCSPLRTSGDRTEKSPLPSPVPQLRIPFHIPHSHSLSAECARLWTLNAIRFILNRVDSGSALLALLWLRPLAESRLRTKHLLLWLASILYSQDTTTAPSHWYTSTNLMGQIRWVQKMCNLHDVCRQALSECATWTNVQVHTVCERLVSLCL